MKTHLRVIHLGCTIIFAAALLLMLLAWPVLAGEGGLSSITTGLPYTSPDSGWSNFAPTGWVTTTTLVASVRVTDSAGLNPTTAVYAYSTDGGVSWGNWASATATADISTTAIITTPLLTLGDGITNAVRFAISDTAAVPATDLSPAYNVRIDSTASIAAVAYLPIVLKSATGDTYEPNDTRSGSYGPLTSGAVYASYIWSPTDTWDCFWFDPSGLGPVTADLTSIPPGTDFDLYLYDSTTSASSVAKSQNPGNANERIVYFLGHDRQHYICVYAFSGWSSTDNYLLSVTYP
jgi:hypothetical protein